MAGVEADDGGDALKKLQAIPEYGSTNFVKEVSTRKPYEWLHNSKAKHHIVALDCGLKYNILRILAGLGCRVTAVPCTTSAEAILNETCRSEVS